MAYIKRGFKEIIMNKTIIFDLDGTLTDSEEGILKSVTYALESFGYEIPPHETLLLFFFKNNMHIPAVKIIITATIIIFNKIYTITVTTLQ